MTSVNSILPGGCVIPPAPATRPLSISATSNDPAQQVKVNGDRVTITGTAKNNGFVPSSVSLSFDGQSVRIPLSGGMTPADTERAIAQALPSGYALIPVPATIKDGTMFRIVKSAPKKNDPQAVADLFQKALDPRSTAGAKVSVAELRRVVNEAKKDGFTADEKQALARQWASIFTGAEFLATRPAQKLYAELQQKHALPIFPIR